MPFDDELAPLKEGAWREVAALDEALLRGEIDEEGWHRAVAELVVPAYLSADTPWGQSGKSGDAQGWEYARSLLADAVDRDGTFLDVGCANGYLMECIVRWAEPYRIEPYGLEIAPELAELARRRLPHWADRIFVGNALHWEPPFRFTFIRTGLEYVPHTLRRQLVAHLGSYCERLIIGVFNEERDQRAVELEIENWGCRIAGRTERPHRHPRLAYRAFWIDG
jgi:protein-L-isoaspartate O-methyltransferase